MGTHRCGGFVSVGQPRTVIAHIHVNISYPHKSSRGNITDVHQAVHLQWSCGSVDPVVPISSGAVALKYLLAGGGRVVVCGSSAL